MVYLKRKKGKNYGEIHSLCHIIIIGCSDKNQQHFSQIHSLRKRNVDHLVIHQRITFEPPPIRNSCVFSYKYTTITPTHQGKRYRGIFLFKQNPLTKPNSAYLILTALSERVRWEARRKGESKGWAKLIIVIL